MHARTPLLGLTTLGWLSLVLSATCFYIGTNSLTSSNEWSYAFWMMTARLLGVSSFVVGAASIFNNHWVQGALLLIGSVALPIVSLLLYGKL